MELFFWCLLGLLMAGYLALAGYDYGVGLLRPVFDRDEPGRRRLLGTMGPFFLGNEVWLVAAVGLLFGAFPLLEGKIFAQNYLIVVALLLGLVAFTAAVQLRSRRPQARRGGWDLLITGGALVVTVAWGLFFGNLVRGVPATGPVTLVDPFSLLWACGFLALFVLHGSVFLMVRGDAVIAAKARTIATRAIPAVLAFVIAVTAWIAVSPTIKSTIDSPWPAVSVFALAMAALAIIHFGLRSNRPQLALTGSMTVCALPVLLCGTMRFPNLLLSLDLRAAAASPETLDLLSFVAPPALLLVIVVQWLSWRSNRRPVDERSLLHF